MRLENDATIYFLGDKEDKLSIHVNIRRHKLTRGHAKDKHLYNPASMPAVWLKAVLGTKL